MSLRNALTLASDFFFAMGLDWEARSFRLSIEERIWIEIKNESYF